MNIKTILIVAVLAGPYCVAQTISTGERDRSIQLLRDSQNELTRATAGLSESQLNFKPDAERWSIKNNVDHLISAENLVWNIIQQCLEQPGEGQHSDFTDDDFVNQLSTRGDRRFNAPERLQPDDGRFETFSAAMRAFDAGRERTIDFVRTTDQNLRAHFHASPLGMLDAYQWTLQIGAHTRRHLEQITEILQHKEFPRN